MSRRPLLVLMLASLVAGTALMVFLEAALTRIAGVTLLFTFIVSGVFVIAEPAALSAEEDGER